MRQRHNLVVNWVARWSENTVELDKSPISHSVCLACQVLIKFCLHAKPSVHPGVFAECYRLLVVGISKAIYPISIFLKYRIEADEKLSIFRYLKKEQQKKAQKHIKLKSPQKV